MRKIFLNSCTLALMSYGNSLTSLYYFKCDINNHVRKVSKTIQDLVEHRKDPSEVCIEKMQIEAEDLPVQYLKGLTLKDCILSGFNLNEVDLSEINLENTQLKNCNLEKTVVWQGLSYQNVLYLKKKAPLELVKIYTHLIKKTNKNRQRFYSYADWISYALSIDLPSASAYKSKKIQYLKKYKFYKKKSTRFYQILNTINCLEVLYDLENKFYEAALKVCQDYKESLSVDPISKIFRNYKRKILQDYNDPEPYIKNYLDDVNEIIDKYLSEHQGDKK